MKTTTTIDTRKTIDRYDIEGFYGNEWSVECSENTYAEARKTLKEYQDNCPQTPFRIKHRVEKNPDFVLTLGALKKGDYDRSQKKYSCGRRDDISYERMLKKDTPVFVDFTY